MMLGLIEPPATSRLPERENTPSFSIQRRHALTTLCVSRFCNIDWLLTATINRLVLAITSKETRETLERWQFDIVQEKEDESDGEGSSETAEGQGTSMTGLFQSRYHR
jgi:hypothetical protein